MTLRVLFVDDEPNVLAGLRRGFHRFHREWDTRFAPGGRAALAALDEAPADVVVSDMRMPGMDGAELLAEVRRRHPRAVRIVLTGECTRESLVRVSAIAHRVLTKPCDPDELQSAVRQASALQGVLLGPDLAAAVGRLRSVPSQPELYAQLLSALDAPDPSLADLGRVCARDVGVSAKLIQVANSALFGGGKPVTGAAAAVQRIGVDMTKALVLADGVLTQFDPGAIRPFTIDHVWPHSRAVGDLAAGIARAEAGGAAWLPLAPSAGVLHDIGRLVLATTAPESYVRVLREGRSGGTTVCEAELREFGVTHAEIGAYLLALWGLPTAIVEAVAWHHAPAPDPGPGGRFDLATAVYAAEAILGADEGSSPDPDYLARLGLADRLPVWAQLAARPTTDGGVA
jgi:HD-like signal output (HDOD) protein/CheY-like chemotaxis protein